MKILVGESSGPATRSRFDRFGWGRMFIFRRVSPYDGESWGFDNGAYRYHFSGEKFDSDAYRHRLDRAHRAGRPLLAVLPDIVGKGKRSLDFSLSWRDKVPPEWPWYLAVQDGMTAAETRPHLQGLAGIFLGGTDAWKATAGSWRELANRLGISFHYGRCGTMRKLAHAFSVSADSVDSAFPLWTKERTRLFHDWTVNGVPQGYLEIAECGKYARDVRSA